MTFKENIEFIIVLVLGFIGLIIVDSALWKNL